MFSNRFLSIIFALIFLAVQLPSPNISLKSEKLAAASSFYKPQGPEQNLVEINIDKTGIRTHSDRKDSPWSSFLTQLRLEQIIPLLFAIPAIALCAAVLQGCNTSSSGNNAPVAANNPNPGNAIPPNPNWGPAPAPNPNPGPFRLPTILNVSDRVGSRDDIVTITLTDLHPATTHIVVNTVSVSSDHVGFPIYLDVGSIRWNGTVGEIDFPSSIYRSGLTIKLDIQAFRADTDEVSPNSYEAQLGPISTLGSTSVPQRIYSSFSSTALSTSVPNAADFTIRIDDPQSLTPDAEIVFIASQVYEPTQATFYFRRPLSDAKLTPSGDYLFEGIPLPPHAKYFVSLQAAIALPHDMGWSTSVGPINFNDGIQPNKTPIPALPIPAATPASPSTPVLTAPLEGTEYYNYRQFRTITAKVDPASLGSATHLVLFYQRYSQVSTPSGTQHRYVNGDPVFIDINSFRTVSPTESVADFMIYGAGSENYFQVVAFDETTGSYSLPTQVESVNTFTFHGAPQTPPQFTAPRDIVADANTLRNSSIDIELSPVTYDAATNSYVPVTVSNIDIVFSIHTDLDGPEIVVRRPLSSGIPTSNGKVLFRNIPLPQGSKNRRATVEAFYSIDGNLESSSSFINTRNIPVQTSMVTPTDTIRPNRGNFRGYGANTLSSPGFNRATAVGVAAFALLTPNTALGATAGASAAASTIDGLFMIAVPLLTLFVIKKAYNWAQTKLGNTAKAFKFENRAFIFLAVLTPVLLLFKTIISNEKEPKKVTKNQTKEEKDPMLWSGIRSLTSSNNGKKLTLTIDKHILGNYSHAVLTYSVNVKRGKVRLSSPIYVDKKSFRTKGNTYEIDFSIDYPADSLSVEFALYNEKTGKLSKFTKSYKVVSTKQKSSPLTDAPLALKVTPKAKSSNTVDVSFKLKNRKVTQNTPVIIKVSTGDKIYQIRRNLSQAKKAKDGSITFKGIELPASPTPQKVYFEVSVGEQGKPARLDQPIQLQVAKALHSVKPSAIGYLPQGPTALPLSIEGSL